MRLAALQSQNGIAHDGNILRRRPLGSPGSEFRLDDQPGFEEFVVGKVVQQHQKIDRFVKDRLRAIGKIGSVADPL